MFRLWIGVRLSRFSRSFAISLRQCQSFSKGALILRPGLGVHYRKSRDHKGFRV